MNTLNIVYVMLQFFAMFYIQKYMSTFFQEVKTRKSVYILSHFIYPILVSTLYFLWNIPLINLLGNIVALFIITCNYKANILKKIACAVFLYVFMLLVEVGVAVSTGYLGISSLTWNLRKTKRYDRSFYYSICGFFNFSECKNDKEK